MKFQYFTDNEITVKQLPTVFSKRLNQNTKDFAKRVGKPSSTPGDIEATDSETAQFIIEQTYMLLKDAYKLPEAINKSSEEFEDLVTLQEVLEFLEEQLTIQGPTDFLVQPVLALVQAMKKISMSMPEIIEKTAREALDGTK